MSIRPPARRAQEFVVREFHVSRAARNRYGFDDALFSFNGNVIFANFRAARLFAQRINEQRDVVNHPELSVRAGDINAMGLVDEILHYIVAQYRQQRKPRVMEEALAFLEDRLGKPQVEEALVKFLQEFPPSRSIGAGRRSRSIFPPLLGGRRSALRSWRKCCCCG